MDYGTIGTAPNSPAEVLPPEQGSSLTSQRADGMSSAQLEANAALSLLNLCCHFLDRRLAAQAAAFEQEGGFTERLYRARSQRRPFPTPHPKSKF
jgi:four helix bundle suffix protein